MIRVYKLSRLEGLNKRKLTMVYVCHNMTRGGGDEDIDGWLRKVLDTRKGGSEKIRERGSENLYTDRLTDRQTDRQTCLFGVLYKRWHVDYNSQISKNYKQQVIN